MTLGLVLTFQIQYQQALDFPGEVALVVRNPPANAGDMGLIPGSGRFPRGGNGNPFQYSCLENQSYRQEPGTLWSTGSQSDMTEVT